MRKSNIHGRICWPVPALIQLQLDSPKIYLSIHTHIYIYMMRRHKPIFLSTHTHTHTYIYMMRRHKAYPVVKTWTLISIPDASFDLACDDCLNESFISFDNSMSWFTKIWDVVVRSCDVNKNYNNSWSLSEHHHSKDHHTK